MDLHIYQSAFKVVYKEANIDAKKVKLTSFNKRNSHRYKHQATEQMAKRIKTQSQLKVARLNERKVKRLDAKLAKGKICIEEYKQALAQL